MRSIAVLLLLAAPLFSVATPASATAGMVRVVRTWSGPRTAESFERISEYFTHRENPGRQTILRSQPSVRAGYYFLIRLDHASSHPLPATFELQVIAPSSPAPRKYAFPSTLPPGSHAFNLGLTGSDWQDQDQPVAWLIVVRGADGAELVREQSFLWAQPSQT